MIVNEYVGKVRCGQGGYVGKVRCGQGGYARLQVCIIEGVYRDVTPPALSSLPPPLPLTQM